MAERNLAVRLAVIDGGKVKAELRDVGESGERALKRIEDAGRPASKALQAVDAAAGQVRGSLESAASRLGPIGAALTRLGPAGLFPLPRRGPRPEAGASIEERERPRSD